MKKHLLGLAIFSFIFASFAALFAFLYAPKIPQISRIEEIRRPVFENDRRYRCNKKSENIKFEVISTQYNLDEMKLISKVKMTLDSYGTMPSRVVVATNLYTSEKTEIPVSDVEIKNFEPKNIQDEVVFYVVSDLGKNKAISRKENLYARFNFFVTAGDRRQIVKSSADNEVKSVLFVHGESSVIKK